MVFIVHCFRKHTFKWIEGVFTTLELAEAYAADATKKQEALEKEGFKRSYHYVVLAARINA